MKLSTVCFLWALCAFAMALADNFECGCCNPYKIAKRLVKLILAIWMIGDMVMDGVTTKMYWDVADVCMNIQYFLARKLKKIYF